MVGLISDTHGLLREEAVQAMRGCELIIHAGDVGKPAILDALRKLAPVVVVRGNIDDGAWGKTLPPTALAEIDGKTIYVLHNIHELDLDPAAAGFHAVVSGHSHKPARFEKAGVLYVNPGSAGPRRFDLPISVAHLDFRAQPWKVDFIELEDRNSR
ncbi:MAG: metallophosphoesterase family protein [Candidatus Acidiferrales bacterium]